MIRTSTSTTKSSSSGSSSHPKPSPPSTVPSLTPQTSYASGSTPSFSPSNAIDDFVLFPEDSWNTDMSLAGLETQDLGQFNFDINDLNQLPQFNDPAFDFSFDPQLSNFQFDNNLGHTPLMADQYGLDQWASSFGGDMPVHTRPHPSGPTRDSGGLDSSFQASWLHDVQDVSPMSESLAQGFFPDGSLQQPEPFQNATTDASPLSSASDWIILEASLNASPAPQGEPNTPASSQSPESSQLRTRKRRATDEGGPEATLPLANQQGSGSSIEVDPSDIPKPGGVQRPKLPSRSQLLSQRDGALAFLPDESGYIPTPSSSSLPAQVAAFADTLQSTVDALQRLSSAPVETGRLSSELQRLRSAIAQVQSSGNAGLSGTVVQQVQTLASRLEAVSSSVGESQTRSSRQHRYNKLDPELRPDYLRECQIQARRIVRSLCATINNVEAQNTGTSSPTDGPMLTSGRNVHLYASESGSQPSRSPASLESGVRMWVESTHEWQLSSNSSSGSSLDSTAGVSQSGHAAASTFSNDVGGRTQYRSLSNLELLAIPNGNSSRYPLVVTGLPSDVPLASGEAHRRQSLSQSQGQAGFASSASLFIDEDLDFNVPVHRYRSYAQANSTSGSNTIGNVESRDPFDRVPPEARTSYSEIDRLQVRRTELMPPSGNLLESQLTQTNAANSSPLAQYVGSPQDASLVLQTSTDASLPGAIPGTTNASQQTQSSAAYQMVLPILATLFASYIVWHLRPPLYLQCTNDALGSLDWCIHVIVTLLAILIHSIRPLISPSPVDIDDYLSIQFLIDDHRCPLRSTSLQQPRLCQTKIFTMDRHRSCRGNCQTDSLCCDYSTATSLHRSTLPVGS